MATVYYEIVSGTPPFTARISLNIPPYTPIAPDNHHVALGTYYFTNIPNGVYIIVVTEDNTGCYNHFETPVECPSTTTTTTIAPTTTTSTTLIPLTTTTTTSIYPVVECLDGIVVEMIYFIHEDDLALLPPTYDYYCCAECRLMIGNHICNSSLCEVFANDIFLGYSQMNNYFGVGGGLTSQDPSKTYPADWTPVNICEDYFNVPDDLTGGVGTWIPAGGHLESRYNRIVVTREQAIDIANSGGGGTTIHFSIILIPTVPCGSDELVHDNVTWIRVSDSLGNLIYSGCPTGEFLDIDICLSTTTTTTMYPPTTTTTTTVVASTTTTTTIYGLETVFIHIPNF